MYELYLYINKIIFLGINVEKSHLLSSIINNIEMQSNYYQKATLNYVVKESDPLFNRLEEKGNLCITKINKLYFVLTQIQSLGI